MGLLTRVSGILGFDIILSFISLATVFFFQMWVFTFV
jgi:hypothetical protein